MTRSSGRTTVFLQDSMRGGGITGILHHKAMNAVRGESSRSERMTDRLRRIVDDMLKAERA